MRIILLLLLTAAAACGPGEPRIPARPPASLPQVNLDPPPKKTSLLDEVQCDMSVDGVNAVLKRLALSPLREVQPGIYTSTTEGIEARVTFREGRLYDAELTEGATHSAMRCDAITASPH